MFNSDDFRHIINQTSELLDKLATASENDTEELKMRIDSNVHALRIMGNQIEDDTLKQRAQEIIRSITATVSLNEKSVVRLRRHSTPCARSEMIDSELLRNAQELKAMASKFKKTIDSDEAILSNLASKMSNNSIASSSNLHKINKRCETGVKSSTYFFISLIIFIIMYFFIKL